MSEFQDAMDALDDLDKNLDIAIELYKDTKKAVQRSREELIEIEKDKEARISLQTKIGIENLIREVYKNDI